jgi:VanZ family protein
VRVTTRTRYAVALSVALCVFLASVLDPPSTTSGPTPLVLGLGLDKYAHAAAYAGVAGSVAWARAAVAPRALLLVALVAAAYGASIELVQSTLPARSLDVADGMANAVGALLGALGWRLWATYGPGTR